MNRREENRSGKSSNIYLINVICCFSVLLLHTNSCFWHFSRTGLYWKTANIIECVFYFAVPVFFMVSGITLMDFYDRYTLKEYFTKRLNKVVIPFLAWNMIAVIWQIADGRTALSEISLRYLYQGITGNTFVQIYWFFNSLFILYLSMPLFAAVPKSRRQEVFAYLVIAGFFLNYLIPFLKTLKGSDLNTPYTVPVISSILIWPLLGWLLHNCEIRKSVRILIYILALLGLMMHMIGTYVLSMKAGEIVRTFKGYQSVPSILYSAGVFVLLKQIGPGLIQNRRVDQFIKWLAGYTFPIYLMQFIFLRVLPKIPGIDVKSLIYRLGAPFIIIPVTIGITWCLRKIPVIRKIVP